MVTEKKTTVGCKLRALHSVAELHKANTIAYTNPNGRTSDVAWLPRPPVREFRISTDVDK